MPSGTTPRFQHSCVVAVGHPDSATLPHNAPHAKHVLQQPTASHYEDEGQGQQFNMQHVQRQGQLPFQAAPTTTASARDGHTHAEHAPVQPAQPPAPAPCRAMFGSAAESPPAVDKLPLSQVKSGNPRVPMNTNNMARWVYPTNNPVRNYQLSITETGLFDNTLVCLPTGLGKTLIAAVIMCNFYRFAACVPISLGPKVSVLVSWRVYSPALLLV